MCLYCYDFTVKFCIFCCELSTIYVLNYHNHHCSLLYQQRYLLCVSGLLKPGAESPIITLVTDGVVDNRDGSVPRPGTTIVRGSVESSSSLSCVNGHQRIPSSDVGQTRSSRTSSVLVCYWSTYT